ncbi:MAG: glycosyltransferase family 4 protein [Acidobacteria bacterium]|nr:glycosyltransferase family 4 protein [Acidobacteriota bacterium]
MARVLFVLNSASGGATRSALDLIEALAPRGWEFCAVLPPTGEGPDLDRLRRHTLSIHMVPLPWWNRNYRARPLRRLLHWGWRSLQSGFHARTVHRVRRLIGELGIDLVHTNTSLTLDPALAARRARVPHVWHLREQMGNGQLFRFWLTEPLLARTFVSLADAVVANSQETRRLFARTGLASAVQVVYNGVRLQDFVPSSAAAELRRSWCEGHDQVVVGMVAHLTSRMKRHDVFVRLAAKVLETEPNVRFVVVGADPERDGGYRTKLEYARDLSQLAQRLGLGDRLLRTGALSDVPAVMSAIDVLVHPSERESFGRVAVEAMAAGKPVVGAATGGVGEIVEDGVTGFTVAGDDPEAWTRPVLALVRDPMLRQSLGTAGHQRVAERFSLDVTADRIETLYREVLSR